MVEKKIGFKTETDDVYHGTKFHDGVPILSNSAMSRLFENEQEFINGFSEHMDSDAMRIGRVAHKVCLESHFLGDIGILPDVNLRTNAGKEVKEKFLKDLEGRDWATPKEMGCVKAMSEELHSHPLASKLLHGGVAEQSEYSMMDGVYCKGRMDYRNTNINALVDYKTTAIDPTKWEAMVFNRDYPRQLAFYSDLANTIEQDAIDTAYIVMQKLKKPDDKNYSWKTDIRVFKFEMEDDSIVIGRFKYQKGIHMFKNCMERGSYNGFPECEILESPKWYGAD